MSEGPFQDSYSSRMIDETEFPPISSGDNFAQANLPSVRVLVIDTDGQSRHSLAGCLKQHDMRVVTTLQKKEVTAQLSILEPNVIILDRRQGGDGFALLREIRSLSDVAIIVTDARGPDEVDCIVGLELGADDYVSQSCSGRELSARIRAVLRGRQRGIAAKQKTSVSRCYRFSGWILDSRTRRLTDPNSEPVVLTKAEFALLIAFLNAPQRPLSRDYLLQATRIHENACDRSIDVQVLRLRRKLEPGANAPRIIQTERGAGYVFALAVETR